LRLPVAAPSILMSLGETTLNTSKEHREYRVEWRTESVFSFLVAARSPAEAIAKARVVPLGDPGWDLEGMTDHILAFPVEQPTYAPPAATADTDARDPIERSYCVSYESAKTYSQNVFAVDSAAACEMVSREDSGWNVLSEWKHWRARPMSA
jgi:hypothetical protein